MLLFSTMNRVATAGRIGSRRVHRRGTTPWRSRRHVRHARLSDRAARASSEGIARAAMRSRRASTLLELVQSIQQQVASDTDVVAIVTWLVNTGAVVLTGNFAGQRI